MLKDKILYLCPSYPFPAKTGGDQCFAQHVKDLLDSQFKDNVNYIFFNIRKDIDPDVLNKNSVIINNKYFKKYSLKWIIEYIKNIFSKVPFGYRKIICSEISKYITSSNASLIILDGLPMCSVLPNDTNYKLIYIAHNIEYDFIIDLIKLEKNIILKLYSIIEACKIKYVEDMILKKSDKIICVSTSDYKKISKKYPQKTISLPHRIDLQERLWSGSDYNTLFFCGAMDFLPNKEAVEWIVEVLSTILPSNIKIKIAGKGTENVPDSWKKDNIEYLGFVSKEELYDLYRKSSAFICPIIYGSGVKIKVTEALSFGMPIIATSSSLEGLNYINIPVLIDRKDLRTTKDNILSLLKSQDNLNLYSENLVNQILNFQSNSRDLFIKNIGECLNE